MSNIIQVILSKMLRTSEKIKTSKSLEAQGEQWSNLQKLTEQLKEQNEKEKRNERPA